MEEAAFLCDKICIIHEGKIIAMDDVDGVIEKEEIASEISFFTHLDVYELISSIDNVQKVEICDGHYTVYFKDEEVIGDIILALKQNDIKYRKLDINRPNLEDVYLKLTGTVWKESD